MRGGWGWISGKPGRAEFLTVRRLSGVIIFWLKHSSLPGPQLRGTEVTRRNAAESQTI